MSSGTDNTRYSQRKGNNDGEITFGHLWIRDGGISAVMLRNMTNTSHFMSLEERGPREGWTICSTPGRHEIVSNFGAGAGKIGGSWIAENGDLVLKSVSGKVRIIGVDVEIVATGGEDTALESTGNIILDAKDRIHVESVKFTGELSSLIQLNTEGTCKIIGQMYTNIYGGLVDVADGSNFLLNKGKGFAAVSALDPTNDSAASIPDKLALKNLLT